VDEVKEIYLKKRKINTHDVINTMGISLEQVHSILNDDLPGKEKKT
jgi:hypothetical protein